jgi:2-isopropylmalate synthase
MQKYRSQIDMLPDKNKVIILDTTLRDGELAPRVQFALQKKIEIATWLEKIGVDIIEVGYPGQYDKDIRDVFEISRRICKATICSLARCEESEIVKVARAIEPASRGRIHLYTNVRLPSKASEERVLTEIARSVRLARSYCDNIQWSAFDATRSDLDFLCRAIAVALDSGVKTIGIPDSLGVALPENFSHLIQTLYNRIADLDRAILSIHCHDDRGMAVENTIAAIESGARQIECTIDGLGARKGNTDLAKVVQTLVDRTGYTTSIQTNYLSQISTLVRQSHSQII